MDSIEEDYFVYNFLNEIDKKHEEQIDNMLKNLQSKLKNIQDELNEKLQQIDTSVTIEKLEL